MHLDEHHGRFENPCNRIGADEERRVLVEERRPVLELVVRWRLVGDERVDVGLAAAAQELAREFRMRNRSSAETSARLAQETVDRGDALRLVDGGHRLIEPRVPGQHLPFPIAEVRGHQQNRLAGARSLEHDLGILHGDALTDLRGRRAVAPDDLGREVAQVAIRLLEDRRARLGR